MMFCSKYTVLSLHGKSGRIFFVKALQGRCRDYSINKF
jgi:hypothetical protein